MKLTCDSCNAKYSIADDRVAGKVFKIRCKKCSHVIIVRGETVVVEPTPAPPAISGEWYAIVDGEQAGPFEREALEQFSADTFVWREGMDDWVARSTLDAPNEPAPTPAPMDAKTLRNERNETSVLFTLGNLAQLAAKPAPAATKPASDGRVEEGSGLIDIRALASTLAPATAAPKPASSAFDLPVYATTSIADPVVLVPTPSRSSFDRRVIVAFVAMLALIGALVTMLIVVLSRDSGTARAAVVEPAPAPVPAAIPVPVAVPVAQPQVAVVPPVPQPAPLPPPPKQPRKQARVDTAPKKVDPPKSDESDCNEISCTYNDFAGNCCDSWKKRQPKTAPPPAPAGDLPENLDRAALAKGIATIKAQRCGAGSSVKGDVHVSVKVTPDGTVSGVTIKSSPDKALAACVEREAKLGTFAKTKRGGSFAYFWRF